MVMISKAKQTLLNEARRLQTKADIKKREVIKLEEESRQILKEAEKL